MSEYQYYEFQAIDRPLTDEEMEKLRSYSTRATITRTSFVNDYSWGAFKGDEDAWMERYFDAFLYLANWGTHVLKLRLPARLLSLETAWEYCIGESASAWENEGNVILSFVSEDEDDGDWEESAGRLSAVIPVRAELMRADRRALYLGWLLCAQNGELDDEDTEPPVPPGLGQLSASLKSLVDFLRVDRDLLDVAAEGSTAWENGGLSRDKVRAWVGDLPAREKDELLARLVMDEDPTLAAELLQRFLEHRAAAGPRPDTPAAPRTVGKLLQAAEARTEERRRAKARQMAEAAERREREAARARAQHLDEIARQEPALWARIDSLIATKQPNRYAEAVTLLVGLRDLAERDGNERKFRTKLEAICTVHARKPAFLERLRKARLM